MLVQRAGHGIDGEHELGAEHVDGITRNPIQIRKLTTKATMHLFVAQQALPVTDQTATINYQ